MTSRDVRKEPSLAGTFSGSVLFHLLLMVLFARLTLVGPLTVTRTIYEVDLLNLPVADPQMGNPAVSHSQPAVETAPPSSPPATTMTAPSDKPRPKGTTTPTPSAADAAFARRMAELEQKANARHQADAIEQLRHRTRPSPAGIPTGTGTERGSDYISYLHSRLVDAFKTTITFQSKDPEVVIRLAIDGKGRVVMSRIERSSGDKLFEDAALRAIAKAARLLVPPPGGASFEHGFVFRPAGIGSK